jgi:drug/metabolite transporter (DMT)-like permease
VSTAAAPRVSYPVLAASLMVGSAVIFTVMNVLIRPASEGLHPLQVVFLRNLSALAFMAPFLFRTGFGVLRTNRLKLHLARGFCFFLGQSTWFAALPHMPLMDANALYFTAPIFITIMAAFVLGETVRWRRWAAVMVGFAGALVVLKPGSEEMTVWHLLMVANALTWSVSALIMRATSATDGAPTIVAYMFLCVTPLSFIPAMVFWQTPSYEALGLIVTIGALSAAGHFMLARAFTKADASFCIPFDYTQLAFAAVADLIVLGLVPAWSSVAGSLLIVAAALYIAHREAAVARTARRAA